MVTWLKNAGLLTVPSSSAVTSTPWQASHRVPERSSAYSTQYETHCMLRARWKNMFKKQGKLTMGLRRCFCDSIF